MNITSSDQKPVVVKLDNNTLFQQILAANPPQYQIKDLVVSDKGIGYISGRVFNEREKTWKYTINPYALKNFHMDNVKILGIHH
jgi:hypothetical protein